MGILFHLLYGEESYFRNCQ